MKTLHKLSMAAAVAVLLLLYGLGGVRLSNKDSRLRRRNTLHNPHTADLDPVYRDAQRDHRLPRALGGAAAAEAEEAPEATHGAGHRASRNHNPERLGGRGRDAAPTDERPPSRVGHGAALPSDGDGPRTPQPSAEEDPPHGAPHGDPHELPRPDPDVAPEHRANELAIVAAADPDRGPDAVSPEELGAADARDAAALEEEAAQEAIHAARSRINGWDGREVALEGDSERHNPNLVPGKHPRKPRRHKPAADESYMVVDAADRLSRPHPQAAVDPEDAAGVGAPEELVPTFEWQVILEGQSVPAGLEISIDLQTGLKKARLMKKRPGIMLPSEIKRERMRKQLQRLRERSELGDHPLVHCDTTQGKLSLEVRFDWAPIGATRFAELVQGGHFTNNVIYRVPPLQSLALAQFGMVPNKQLQKQFDGHKIKDDTLHPTIKKGDIAFAGSGPDSRTCQLWVARADSDWLGKAAWETPVARIATGMAVIDNLHEVGDLEPWGNGPAPSKIHSDKSFYSNFPGRYLTSEFPDVDYWKSCQFADEYTPAPPGDPNEEFEL